MEIKNVVINGCGSESTSFECIIYNKGKMVAIASNSGNGYSTSVEYINNQSELNELIDEFGDIYKLIDDYIESL